MQRRLLAAVVTAVVAGILLPVVDAEAGGGHYVFVGGTANERATVRNALAASSFNWNLVPGTTTVRIARGLDSSAVPGEIRLDADLLDAGGRVAPAAFRALVYSLLPAAAPVLARR